MEFIRAAAVSPRVKVGNCRENMENMIQKAQELEKQGVQALVFPELAMTGATCQDLFWNSAFLAKAREALEEMTRRCGAMLLVAGVPVAHGGRLYNCAAVMKAGRLLALCGKKQLVQGEERWFSPCEKDEMIPWEGGQVLLSPRVNLETAGAVIAVRVGEDVTDAQGAQVLLNPCAVNELAGRHQARACLFEAQTRQYCQALVHANAGFGESTTDLVFAGYTAVYENGRLLKEGPRFSPQGGQAAADIDLARLLFKGRKAQMPQAPAMPIPGFKAPEGSLWRKVNPLPFVPQGEGWQERCREITAIQVTGLRTRLEATGIKKMVIGVSGGLDSTLALLVAARTAQETGLPASCIYAITMPGFGTGQRTYSNATRLMGALGVILLEIPIAPAVRQHFQDIGHEESVHDVTYENAQARERTQILMDYANKVNGLVLGTGDMSEEALGFCTYNGDHMSMYNVNGSVPKTLMRTLTGWLGQTFGEEVGQICRDIVETPVSPELLPVSEGELNQRTEDILGDYALHDFFLYHLMDSGAGLERLERLALEAFRGVYDAQEIQKTLQLFNRRFFQQQFKRSCMPDGPKVGAVALSPRGGLSLPSDLDYKPLL